MIGLRQTCAFGLIFLGAIFWIPAALADECAPLFSARLPLGVNSIKIAAGSGVNSDALTQAKNKWNGCSGPMPNFVTSGAADFSVSLEFQDLASPSTCGRVAMEYSWNAQRGIYEIAPGTKIITYAEQADGTDCLASQGRIARTYAHEMGHILGLDNGSCSGRIMGPANPGSESVNDIQSEDCTAAVTATSPSDGQPDGGNEENVCVEDPCETTPPSPVLISTLNANYGLTALHGAS